MVSLLKSTNIEVQNTVKDDGELLRSESFTNYSNVEVDISSNLDQCIEHRQSYIIEFIKNGKKIQMGSCLEHSEKGCITFSGIDLQTGQLLCITEWMIKYSQLDAKCEANCHRENTCTPCVEHSVDAVIANIENQMMILSQLKHKNLVHYECVQCVKQTDGILVYIVQDFVFGNRIDILSSYLGWGGLSISMVAKSVMDALIFLQSQNITHGALNDTSVYIDNCSMIRVTNFALVPYIQNLIGENTVMQNDVNALGVLVQALSPILSTVMIDFIDKCISQNDGLFTDLKEHPFLQLELCKNEVTNDEDETNNLEVVEPICATINPFSTSGSRFKSDYTILEHLGSGAFADVYKVKYNLDNSEYAIKEIRPGKNRTLHDLNKEIRLISQLHHENIVRYFTGWNEITSLRDDRVKSNLISNTYSTSISDYIEFVNSSNDKSDNTEVNAEEFDYEDTMLTFVYIQMEYCANNTLRTLIDNRLYDDIDRMWRLFREIVEGLAYMHKQGIVHRDLKPDNIFIQSQDRIKIGDFGLATICRPTAEIKEPILHPPIKTSTSLTANIGTELYSAPEIDSINLKIGEKVKYNEKVDIYSLGIILLEMSCAPFSTQMERYQVIKQIRTASITMPNIILDLPKYQLNVKVMQWLLNHNSDERPTAEELLRSEIIPRTALETNEIDEMICNTIAHPERKEYKNLVARCLQQESPAILDLTYFNVSAHNNTFDYVKSTIVNGFRKHGAIEVATPLLTQCTKNYVTNQSTVRLMTHSGNNVFLPHDLRLPFARHIAISGINSMRRYSIDRVYRENFNNHPIQLHDCAFDIITPNPGSLLVDAELISIAYDIATTLLPKLKQNNVSIRINHTSLLRAIFMDFNVPPSKYNEVANILLQYAEGKIVNSKIKQLLNISNPRNNINLFNVLTTEILLSVGTNRITDSYLNDLIDERSPAANLAKQAIQNIESVVELARGLCVTCEISLLPGLPVGYERTKSGGVVWQMLAKQKLISQEGRYLLAAGERYDSFLTEFQKSTHKTGFSIPKTKICGAGFSFLLENLMYGYATLPIIRIDNHGWAPVQILVCVLGTGPPLIEVIDILNSLWAAGICSGFIEARSSKNARDMARKLGARNILVQNENKGLTLRTFVNQNMLQDRQITRAELINTLNRMIQPNENNFKLIIDDLKRKMFIQAGRKPVKPNNKKKVSFGKLSRAISH